MNNHAAILETIRKILNETRQDRVCRPLLSKKNQPELIPFLGSVQPAYFFLGVNPVGYDISQVPVQAEEYIEFAQSYFEKENHDKASFAGYLSYTANQSGDFTAFGQATCLAYLIPILTQRSSEVTAPLAKACWPRSRRLLECLRPNLILLHGALTWKFLSGQEGEELVLTQCGDSHRRAIPELYEQLEAEKIPFQSQFDQLDPDYRPWIVALPHLSGAGVSKDTRRKAELAVQSARRRLSGGPAVSTSGGTRIRVRRPD